MSFTLMRLHTRPFTCQRRKKNHVKVLYTILWSNHLQRYEIYTKIDSGQSSYVRIIYSHASKRRGKATTLLNVNGKYNRIENHNVKCFQHFKRRFWVFDIINLNWKFISCRIPRLILYSDVTLSAWQVGKGINVMMITFYSS